MTRQNIDTWKNIMRNLEENDEEVEVIWLDGCPNPSEWVLACGEELFEDGFSTEKEAQMRLDEIARY